jgi:hypothetical protein
MTSHRRLGKVLVASLLLNAAVVSAPTGAAAAMPLCTLDGYHNLFVGNAYGSTSLRGAQTTIEWFNDQLCTQRETFDYSWSLAWVGIVGVQHQADDIFQGGFARCSSVGLSCPTTEASHTTGGSGSTVMAHADLPRTRGSGKQTKGMQALACTTTRSTIGPRPVGTRS